MDNRRWLTWDRLMRLSHLYTGLFLVPWMTVYAISAFCLNHKEWINERMQVMPKWELVSETRFVPDAEFPDDPAKRAEVILEHVGLAGPHNPPSVPAPNQLTVLRMCGTGHYRVAWDGQRSLVTVDKLLPFSFYSFVNFLHFQHGYSQPYATQWVWAIVVDVVTSSTVIWIISGIWLWARRPRNRRAGGLCMVAGTLLFAGLAILLCR